MVSISLKLKGQPMFSLFQYLILFFFIIIALSADRDEYCNISRCRDNGPPIRFPFRLKNMQQPERCSYPGFELSCDHKNQTVLELPKSVKLVVNDIDYTEQVIRAYDPYSCIPRQLLDLNLSSSHYRFVYADYSNFLLFNCSPPERKASYLVPCLNVGQYQVYAIDSSNQFYIYELASCIKIGEISQPPFDLSPLYTGNLSEISKHQNTIVELTWTRPYCFKCETEGKKCDIKNYNTTAERQVECYTIPAASKKSKRTLAIGLFYGIISLVPVVIALYCAYTSHKTKKDDQVKVDIFLEDYKALRPTRYSFDDIKKITKQFKEKLGAGGHGTVFKGKLSSEIFVAVKVLSDSVGSGDEFINEVGTMVKSTMSILFA